MRKMRRFASAALASVMALSLVACGSSGADNSGAANGAVDTANQDTTVAEQTTAQADVKAEKVTVQLNSLDDLNPFLGDYGETISGTVRDEIFQKLMNRDGFGGELKPVLMESYEKESEEVYHCKLYDGIVDSAGNSITASDVKFSIEEYQRQGLMNDANNVKEVIVDSDLEFTLVFNDNPSANTFEGAVCAFNIVSEESFTASPDKMVTTPIASGPYKVEEGSFSSGIGMTLVLNENYWEADRPELIDLPVEMQNVEVIDCKVISESSQITMALQTDTIDYSESVTTQDLVNFQDGGAYAEKYNVYSSPKNNANVLAFNSSEESPLHDPKLREAIMYAIDSAFIAGAINGGGNVVSYVLGGPNYDDYNSEWENLVPEYNLETAKELMAESEYPDGVELTLICHTLDPALADIGEILLEELAPLGITLKVSSMELGTYLTYESDPTKWDFTIANFSNPSGAIVNVWGIYFDGSKTGTGLTKNFVDDSKLQELIQTAELAETHTQDNVDAAWEYIMENHWIYGLFLPLQNYVYNSELITAFGFNNTGSVVPGGCTYNVQ